VTYDELLANATSRTPDEPEEDDPVVLMYTGGTTGLPKGVLLDQRAEMLNLYHVMNMWRFDADDVYLHQTPMFHAASMGGILGTPIQGSISVILSLFDPARAMELIEQYGVTATVMVPTMIGMMINEHRVAGPRLRSAGRALPGVALTIQDPDGNTLPPGETGEVCARGGNFMREYWKQPEATADAFRGGWYHSGDAGYLDSEGYLFLVDRVKDMIVTGGENVYSVEVENALASHSEVLQVAVIGIPSDQWGEAVHAIVVVREGATVTDDELIAHAREWIAGYKVPKSVKIQTEPLPLSGAMKVLKRELRAPYWEGHERGVN